jgi:outer membrane protein TolC
VNPLNKRSRRAAIALGLLATLGAVPSALAQTALTLPQAIARARTQNPDAGSAAAAEREAAQRVAQARAGYLPKVDVVESWQRGDQPVFVFSSLLGQRQFTADDFSLAALNHPQALDNFRSAITVEQALFDGTTRANVAAAGLGHTAASVNRLRVDQDLAASVTAAYGRVLATAAAAESAAAAVETAQADRDLSGNRRDAGLVTDADVLQLDVYVSQTRERQIRASSDERIARAELNQLMGEPLDALFVLDRFPGAAAIDVTDLTSLQAEALENRPDVKLAALQEEFAGVAHTAARAAFLPQVSVQGGWEFNGGTWGTRASSWVVGAVARINLFRGFGDKARLAEAEEQAARRALESEKARTSAALAVHIAAARLEAARASEAVGRAAVAQARESQRIVRDRYEAGLTDVASLLRAAEVVVQAEAQQTAAQVAVLTETAALERSLGRR